MTESINGIGATNMNYQIKVLMYHRVVESEDEANRHWSNISAAQLKKHMSLLYKWGFTPITFRDYLLYDKGEISLPKKPVIITFDDGYKEVYDLAFPIIKEFGWNAVLFVLGSRKVKADVWNNNNGFGNAELLEDYQIIEMHESGFEIGSHSMTHVQLPLMSYQTSLFEINKSKEKLQELIQYRVESFSYPYGLLNESLKKTVQEAGYKLACGVYTGPPKFWGDRFDIRRITINNTTDMVGFALKMLAPFEYYEWLGSQTARRIFKNKHKYV